MKLNFFRLKHMYELLQFLDDIIVFKVTNYEYKNGYGNIEIEVVLSKDKYSRKNIKKKRVKRKSTQKKTKKKGGTISDTSLFSLGFWEISFVGFRCL